LVFLAKLRVRDLVLVPIVKDLRVQYLRQKRLELQDEFDREKAQLSKSMSQNNNTKSAVLYNPIM
jgi:hypothetical protein